MGDEAAAVLLIVGAVLIVVLVVVRGFRPTLVQHHHETVVRTPPDVWLDQVALAVGGLPNHRVTAAGPSSISVVRTGVPSWAVGVAVLAFPVGLLALVAKREWTATVAARRRPDGLTTVTLNGWFDTHLIARINALIT